MEAKKCTQCKSRYAEPGHTYCWECIISQRETDRIKKRKNAIKEEKKMMYQPAESLDEVARKAREAGMTYGKYLAARAAGRVK